MKASDYSLYSGVLSRSTDATRFVVPVYQRNYDWQNEHCEKLLDDIINSGVNNDYHFLGSVVTVEVKDNNNVNNFIIIDGQQRITTVFLILRILMDIEGIKESEKQRIGEVLNLKPSDTTKVENEETRLRLKLIKTDAEQLDSVFHSREKDIDKNSNIVKNYQFLKKQIQDKTRNDKDIGQKVLQGIENLTCVWILLDPKDKPQEIFESINSTGMELSVSDLVRNHLLMTEANQDSLYENYWLKMETNILKVDPEKVSENLSEFFRHYLCMKNNSSIKKKDTYRRFVGFVNRLKEGGNTNEDVLKELLKFSKIYSYLLKGGYLKEDEFYDEEINYYLYKLYELKQTTPYPFLMKIFYEMECGNINKEEISKTLLFLIKFILRKLIVDNGTQGANKIYPELYLKSENENGIFSYEKLREYFASNKMRQTFRIPIDSQVEETLRTGEFYGRDCCKPILEILENSTEKEMYAKGSADTDFSGYTIDHIMPQNTNKWKEDLEKNPNWEEQFESLCGNIGNLTLTKINSEMSNERFPRKKHEMEEAKDQCEFLHKEIYDNDSWNFEIIRSRQERLTKRLLNVLHVELPSEIKKEYYSLDDDLTNQKISRYEIDGRQYDSCAASRDFFINVLKYCFDYYSDKAENVVKSGDCKRIVGKGEDAFSDDTLANPVHIRNGIYANVHGSNLEICKKLKIFLNFVNDDLAKSVRIYTY